MSPRWQKDRADLNHDWLRNRFIVGLGNWLRILEGSVSDPDFEEGFLVDWLPEWERNQGNILCLIQRFEREMSPAVLFEMEPLSRVRVEVRESGKRIVDSLWRLRYPIREWQSEAFERLAEANRLYAELGYVLSLKENRSSVADCRDLVEGFKQFRQACHELSEALSNFPHEMLII
jgi:hypothetical protein